MRYFTLFNLAAFASAAPSFGTMQMTYDPVYDNPSGNLNSVACSDGPNGLITKYGWTTFSQIPAFTHIGGSFQISYNSPNCGNCYKLTNPSNGNSCHMLGIDYADQGFNVATSVFTELVGSTAPGNVQVNWRVVPDWFCRHHGPPPPSRGVSGTAQLTYDPVYDNGGQSLNTVACSDGSNGVENSGANTFSDLSNFPNLGGAFAIPGYNSPNCGTCWAITYNGKTVNMLAIDHAGDGFNIAQSAFVQLVGTTAPGVVQVSYTQVDASVCLYP